MARRKFSREGNDSPKCDLASSATPDAASGGRLLTPAAHPPRSIGNANPSTRAPDRRGEGERFAQFSLGVAPADTAFYPRTALPARHRNNRPTAYAAELCCRVGRRVVPDFRHRTQLDLSQRAVINELLFV